MKAQVIKVTHDDLVGTIEVLKAFRQICSDSPKEEGRQETIDALTMAIVICTAFLCDNFVEEAEEEQHDDG